MTSLQLCLPYWGIYYIDRSLSHTTGTGRCWLSLEALSKLFLKAAWAVLTHSPSISTYAKEKTTAISSTRSSGAQVFALFSQQDQYISTEIRDDCFNVSLHLPTCLHSLIISSRIFAGWVLSGRYYLSFGICECPILGRCPCMPGSAAQENNTTKQSCVLPWRRRQFLHSPTWGVTSLLLILYLSTAQTLCLCPFPSFLCPSTDHLST